MSYTLTIGQTVIHSGDAALYVLETPALTITDILDGRSQLTCTLYDQAGTMNFQPTTPVTLVDSVAGMLFSGYINDCTKVQYYPNAALSHQLTCMDAHYLADKRAARHDYVGQFAGDIVVDFMSRYLAAEGVTANFAQDTDTVEGDFATGLLNNVTPTAHTVDGALELSPAGTPLSLVEDSTADWNNNLSLTGLDTAHGSLRLASHATMQMTGTAGLNFGNAFAYQQFASLNYTIQAGDFLLYTVWVNGGSPQIMCGVDFVCSDGTTLRDFASTSLVDQNGLLAHPKQDLSGFATNQWYARQIAIGSMAGKVINLATLVLEGDNQGTYTGYVRDVGIWTSSGGVVTTRSLNIYSSSGVSSGVLALPVNTRIAANGYSNVSLTAVVGYEQTGTRTALSTSLTPVGIYQASLLTWQQSSYPTPATGATPTSVVSQAIPAGTTSMVATSIDNGATFQAATNFAPVPTLMPGAQLAGRTLQTQQTLAIIGPDPTVTPSIDSVTWALLPAYVATKHDIFKSMSTQADFNAGTKTNTTALASGDLTIVGNQRSWLGGGLSGQTMFGNGASPGMSVQNGMLAVTCVTGSQAFSRFDFAGNWGTADFTASMDIKVDTAGQWSGFTYMSTGLSNTLNSFAYRVDCNLTSINLARGGNGTSSITTLGGSPVPISLHAGDLHTLTVAYTASTHTHKVSLDGTVYITVVDATYTAAGTFAAAYNNSSGATSSGYFQNFGVAPSAAIIPAGSPPSWVSPVIALSTMIVEQSVVVWNAQTPNGTTVVVNARVNGGTYFPCTSGSPIPGLAAGTALTTATVQFQVLLQTPNAASVPTFNGLTAWVLSSYSSSGYRISPALLLDPVGRVGSTLVNWNANVAAGASLFVDTSTDPRQTIWTQIGSGAQGSAAIAGVNGQPDPVDDSFSTDSSSLYVQTNASNGSPASWVWDTPISRVEASGGVNAFLLNAAVNTDDVELTVDMDTSDAGGLVWRVLNSLNFYSLVLSDAASTTPGVATIFKVVNSVRTTLVTTSALSWARGDKHRFKLSMVGPLITCSVDGAPLLSFTDNHPLGAGQCGLRNSTVGGQSAATFYNLRVQQLGDSALSTVVFVRTRLGTTDPTTTPQLMDITTSVRSPDIFSGAFMPTTAYSIYNGSQNSLAHDLDDMARQSNGWWRIARDPVTFAMRLKFQAHMGTLSPWVLNFTDLHIGWGASFKSDATQYRTNPIIQGGTDTVLSSGETFLTNGIQQDFTVDYPIDSIVSLTANGHAYTFGLKGIDTGRDFYYALGNNTINQDATVAPLPAGLVFTPVYYGQINVVAEAQSATQIAAQAALDGTSGIIEVPETAPGTSSAAAQQIAGSRLIKDGVWAQQLICTTPRVGLAVGQFLPVFLPQFTLTDWQGLIVGMTTVFRNDNSRGSGNDAVPYFTLTAVSGPVMNSWSTVLAGTGH